MAQKVTVELVDDLDGTVSDDISTVTFGLEGNEYEIDLTGENANKLRDKLASFVDAARRTGGRTKRGSTVKSVARSTTDREQTRAIRTWARENGHDLSDRGRIPGHIVEAFETAHNASKVKQPVFSG
jgi:Lsr2